MNTPYTADSIRRELQCLNPRCPCHRPNGLAHCPAHDDRNPSLSVTERDGRILVHCHAGCPSERVIDALRQRGLWPTRESPANAARETRYEIRDRDGTLVATHVRVDTPSGKRMWWERGGRKGLGGIRPTDLPLYGIHQLGDAHEVIVVEGEKAAAALLALGYPTVGTVCGASATPSEDVLRPLAERTVFLWPDNDEPGRRHMQRIAERLHALGCQDLRWVEWDEAPESGDAADAVARGGRALVDQLLARAEPARFSSFSSSSSQGIVGKAGRETGAFALTPLGDLLNEPEEAVAWLVEGLLPSGGVSLLAAKPKVGKSTTARCLALCVARGMPFLGRTTVQGPVVYLALEEKRAEVAKHFRRLGATEADPIHIHVGAAPEAALEALAAVIDEYYPALVIVDPLLRLVRVRDANDYAEVTRALEPVIELARLSGSHIMLIHHASKGERTGGDAILGSTALFGAVDTALLMKRNPIDGQRTIESIQRYGVDLPESVIVLDEETGRVTLAGTVAERRQREVEEAVLSVLSDRPMTEQEVREAVQLQGLAVSRALRSLVERGLVERSGAGRRGDPFRYTRAREADEGGSNSLPALPAISPEEPEEKEENRQDDAGLVAALRVRLSELAPVHAGRLADVLGVPFDELQPLLQELLERGEAVTVHGEMRVMRHSVLTLPTRRDAAA
jgi:DNA-binding transcriptional ArsR family regulator